MLLNGELSREAALSVLHAYTQYPEQGFTDVSDGYHAIRDVYHLLRSGEKIQAVKKFRETFRVGLKGSKDAVESIHDLTDFTRVNGL